MFTHCLGYRLFKCGISSVFFLSCGTLLTRSTWVSLSFFIFFTVTLVQKLKWRNVDIFIAGLQITFISYSLILCCPDNIFVSCPIIVTYCNYIKVMLWSLLQYQFCLPHPQHMVYAKSLWCNCKPQTTICIQMIPSGRQYLCDTLQKTWSYKGLVTYSTDGYVKCWLCFSYALLIDFSQGKKWRQVHSHQLHTHWDTSDMNYHMYVLHFCGLFI